MKKNSLLVFLVAFVGLFSSCEIIGDIFQAGVWVGIIIAVAVVALIIYFINKAKH